MEEQIDLILPPEVASEVIDALLAAKKHEITILSRKVRTDPEPSCSHDTLTSAAQQASTEDNRKELAWRTVNYDEKSELIEALRGIHTVLSFIQLLKDPNQQSEKNLIDAAITVGVKRFAPSQWGR